MSLKSLTYSEYANDPRHWELAPCDFEQINLIVGRNATGKTRLVNVINGLCKILSAKQTNTFQSGTYHAVIILSGKTYSFRIEFSDGQVISESLDVDGVRRLTREASGRGSIFYEQVGTDIEFEVPENLIAIQQRRDALQHPFVTELAKWAQGSQAYFFGSSLGKELLIGLGALQGPDDRGTGQDETADLVRTYVAAFNKYKKRFDVAIIRDMKALGYDLSDVGADDMRPFTPGLRLSEPLIGMFVTESDRNAKLPQMMMSQGMFRALALIIHINIASFSKQHTLILIDDIGEGLDYERSTSLIDILTRHAKKAGLQVLMTSNDRFVMNRVPLEYWSLLRRTGGAVRVYTERNSPKEFSDFKFMGLSNFDFLTSATFQ